MGGLGNQMFQYAFGKSLSKEYNEKLCLNLQHYYKDELKKMIRSALHFRNSNGILNCIKFIKQNRRKYDLKYFILDNNVKKIYKNKKDYQIIKELQEFVYDQKMISYIHNPSYLGYFCNEKYFLKIKDIILNDFKLKKRYEKHIPKNLNKAIIDSNSVSIHIRRGDYVNSKETNKFHGLLDIDYYYKSINLIKSKINNPKFFIFSDDIDWCKANINFNETELFFVSKLKNYQDLILMSRCKHNVIANSTFSWWSAWLNKNNNKIVLAPKKWLAINGLDYSDLIPKSWIIL